jgi:hypothetical protein
MVIDLLLALESMSREAGGVNAFHAEPAAA